MTKATTSRLVSFPPYLHTEVKKNMHKNIGRDGNGSGHMCGGVDLRLCGIG